MFRESGNPIPENLQIFLNSGGLGDCVAALPAVVYATKQAQVSVWVPNFFTKFAREILPANIHIMNLNDIKNKPKNVSEVQMFSPMHTPMRMHLTDYASTCILDKMLDPNEKNYLKYPVEKVDLAKFNLPENYVVLTPGHTAPVREWRAEILNEIIEFIISKKVSVVFLGSDSTLTVYKVQETVMNYKAKFNDSVDYHKGLNLVNKTGLGEATAIMAKARAVVGLDNGLLHLAGCTDVPILGGFTTVEPKYRLPYRHDTLGWNYYSVVPPETLGCRFCQSNWSFVYDHSFTKCWYQDYACTKQLDAKLYIEKLEELL